MIRWLSAGVIVCLSVFWGQVWGAQPNMIFVLVDDLRFDGMGFVNPALKTPHIDQLAKSGVYFPNAVVTTSLCSPSRATILTGMSTRNHKIFDNNNTSEAHLTFFPSYLQEAGFTTAFVGKWHMGRAKDDPRPGFDHWVSFKGQGFYNPTDRIPDQMAAAGVRHQLNVNGQSVPQTGYITDELTDCALAWLDDVANGNQPFFLYLSHKAVHSDATPAPRHEGQYAEVDIPLPDPNADAGAPGAGKPMWVHNQRNSWHGVDFAYHRGEGFADYVGRYYATLSAVDDSIGRLIKWLGDNDKMDNTILVFYSDNGFLFGDHGLIDKRNAYEASVRVPMVVWAPGRVDEGQVNRARIRNLDLAPTFLDLGGASKPEQMEGQSFKPLLTNKPAQDWDSGDFVYEYYWEWTFPQTPTTFSITRDEVKYIQYHGLWDLDELYDLKADPQERVNLLHDTTYRNRLIDLRAALFAALKRPSGEGIVPFSEKRAQGLRFRNRQGSGAAQFPESFMKSVDDEGLFEGFMPPARVEQQQ
ncbi:MAG: sulfatase [Pseudomonadota bacterium]